jgi:anti-sigma factor ChrR (cupin superfamily)
MDSSNINQPQAAGITDFTGRRHYRTRDEDWRPLQIDGADIPGYFSIPLSDDEDGSWSSYWMKIQPGARGPEHRHDTTELIFVAEGDFADSDGATFQTGDVLTYLAGSSHSSSSATGCVVLVVARTESRLVAQ